MSARWVGATSKRGWVLHAVWVTHDSEIGPRGDDLPGWPDGPIPRPGVSVCGVNTPHVIAGPNGGHDWDRTKDKDKCINCRRWLGELGP